MNFLKRLFSTHSEFVGDFIETGDELFDLAASNTVVAAELELFEARARDVTDATVLENAATRSANALSGYGISVRPKAFLETVNRR